MFPSPAAAVEPKGAGAPSGAELCRVVLAYTAALEPACLDRAAARAELGHLGRAAKALQAALAMVGARLAEMGNKDHAAQVGKELARIAGTSAGAAAGALQAARA